MSNTIFIQPSFHRFVVVFTAFLSASVHVVFARVLIDDIVYRCKDKYIEGRVYISSLASPSLLSTGRKFKRKKERERKNKIKWLNKSFEI